MVWPQQDSSRSAQLDPIRSGTGSTAERLADAVITLKPQNESPTGSPVPRRDPHRNAVAIQVGPSARRQAFVRPCPVPCNSLLLAHDHLRELWLVCTAKRHGRRGPLRLLALRLQRRISCSGDGCTLRWPDPRFPLCVLAVCLCASQSLGASPGRRASIYDRARTSARNRITRAEDFQLSVPLDGQGNILRRRSCNIHRDRIGDVLLTEY